MKDKPLQPKVVQPHAGKDGTLAEYCTLPAENLLLVPEELTDQEACFAEPLAAACRIVEQEVGVRASIPIRLAVQGWRPAY